MLLLPDDKTDVPEQKTLKANIFNGSSENSVKMYPLTVVNMS